MTSTLRASLAKNTAVIVASVWLGMVIGVSFLATPVKLTAPSLELGPALDVGRVTFGLFSRVEWILAAVTAAAIFLSAPPRATYAAGIALVAALLVQSGWLLPELNERVQAVLDASPLAPSWHHAVYAVLEALKALLLIVVVATEVRRPRSDSRD